MLIYRCVAGLALSADAVTLPDFNVWKDLGLPGVQLVVFGLAIKWVLAAFREDQKEERARSDAIFAKIFEKLDNMKDAWREAKCQGLSNYSNRRPPEARDSPERPH